MTPIVALDLATETGWAYRTSGGRIRSGSKKLPKDPGHRLVTAEEWLTERLAPLAGGAGSLVYERPIALRYRAAIRVAFHLEAVLLMVADAWKITDVRTYAPKAIKKHVTGNGNASKQDVLDTVNRKLGLALTNHNQADALALLRLHCSRHEG